MAVTAIYVLLGEAFPGIDSNLGTFRTLLGEMSRTDTIFWCARLNLVVSNPANKGERAKEDYGLGLCWILARLNRLRPNSDQSSEGGCARG
jgi:hypothetical protein